MGSKNLELIRQSLSAAESSIRLAKQLLSELDSGSDTITKPNSQAESVELPGITGIFDGESMMSESGETFPVPANYASKSMLVVGDTLKLVEEGQNKDKRFKQIEHVKRHKSIGILTKKDGKWKVVTPEGSYKVLGAAVEHFGADIGTEVTLHLPANNLTVAYGAIESAKRKEGESEEKQEIQVKAEQRVEEVKKEPKAVIEELLPKPAELIKPVEVVQKPQVKKEPPKVVVVKKDLPPKEEVKPVITIPKPATAQTKTEPVIELAKIEPPKAEAPSPTETVVSPQKPMEISPEDEELI